jgi:hypothetical protein
VTTTEWIAMACRPGERKILHKKRSPCLAKACTRGQAARAGVDPFRTRRKGGPACYAPPIRVASRHVTSRVGQRRGARANSPLSPSPSFLQSLSAPQPVPLPRSRPGSPLPTHPPACHPHFLFYQAQHTSRRLKYSGATTTTGGRVLEEDPRPTSAIKAPRAPVTGLAPPPF